MDEPSKAILVPANRFEVLECRAALEASEVGAQDTPPLVDGALDVLAQHVLGSACARALRRARSCSTRCDGAAPYASLDRPTFDRVVDFVATGGYALRSYERYAKIRRTSDGRWRVANPRVAQQYRLNVGTIVEAPMLNVRYVRSGRGVNVRGGPTLGKIEEYFLETMTPGDTFLFAGAHPSLRGHPRKRVLRLQRYRRRCQGADVCRRKVSALDLPCGRGPRHAGRSRSAGQRLPEQVADWLRLQQDKSVLPGRRRTSDRDVSARPTAFTWSSMPSRADLLIRRSACS